MVALLLGKMKDDKPRPEAKDGPSEGALAAAEEMLGAVKSGDAGEFARALSSFISIEGNSKSADDSEAA